MSTPNGLPAVNGARSAAAPSPSLAIDLTALDEAEDEASWVTELLANAVGDAPSLQALEASLGRLLSSLELASSDEAANVDRIIDTVSRSVPRLAFDLQLMREHALLLRYTLDGLNLGTVTSAAAPVTEVMDRLARMDTAKTRMEAARDVLREAEAWSSLDGEVSALVGERAYARAAERLHEAARSMAVFANTPEYEPRRSLLLSLQNSLEAAVSTPLVAAINARDIRTCRALFAVFAQIERESEFRQYYYASRRAAVVEAWRAAHLLDGRPITADGIDLAPPSTAPVPFATFLPQWYGQLYAALEEERPFLDAIFPDPAATLAAFLQSILDALSPSMSERIADVVEQHGAHALAELIALYHATEQAGVRVEALIATLASSPAAANDGAVSPEARPARRSSKRNSMARRSSARTPSFSASSFNFGTSRDEVGPTAWEVSLFEPFLDWQVDYPSLERRLLEADAPRPPSTLDPRSLADTASAVLAMAEDTIGRSVALTHGYGAVGAVEAADRLVSRALAERREAVVAASGRRGDGPSVNPSSAQVELEGLDYSADDWARFQLGLRLLEACRTLADRLGAFETKARARLVGLARTMREAAKDPLGFAVPGVPRGALILLRQSSLNSADLARLIDAIDPPSGAAPTSLVLLPAARGSAVGLTRASQSLLHDTVLRPLIAALASYAASPVWAAEAEPSRSAYDLPVPTFSLSPTETISRLGEGLFNLPRLFEVYASDDALGFSIETLPFVDAVPLPSQQLSAEAVVSTWLSSLTLSVLSHLTVDVLPTIRRLSARGCAQLATDLGYLGRIASVLEAESDELERWREAVELDEATLRTRLAEAGGSDEVLDRVGRLRASS